MGLWGLGFVDLGLRGFRVLPDTLHRAQKRSSRGAFGTSAVGFAAAVLCSVSSETPLSPDTPRAAEPKNDLLAAGRIKSRDSGVYEHLKSSLKVLAASGGVIRWSNSKLHTVSTYTQIKLG